MQCVYLQLTAIDKTAKKKFDPDRRAFTYPRDDIGVAAGRVYSPIIPTGDDCTTIIMLNIKKNDKTSKIGHNPRRRSLRDDDNDDVDKYTN